jgi:hypothetical protein
MSPETIWTIPGWGLAFTMWALATAAGAVVVLVSGLIALRGKRKRDRSGGRR